MQFTFDPNKVPSTFHTKQVNYIASLGVLLMLSVVTVSIFEEMSLWGFVVCGISSPFLIYVANSFFEGYEVLMDTEKKTIAIETWSGISQYQNKNLRLFSLDQISSLIIEKTTSKTRLVLLIANEQIPLTQSYSSGGYAKHLAETMRRWLSEHGYNAQVVEK